MTKLYKTHHCDLCDAPFTMTPKKKARIEPGALYPLAMACPSCKADRFGNDQDDPHHNQHLSPDW